MKNFKVEVKKKGIEILILTIHAEKEDGTKVERDIDFSGNTGSVPTWVTHVVLGALNDLNQ